MQISQSVRSMINRDGGILLDIDQNLMFSINVVGSKIWQGFQAGQQQDKIVEELAGQFEITLEQARSDLEAFIKELRKHNLLTNGH